MKVLVIGHTGQLGHYLMERLTGSHDQVTGVDSSQLDITNPAALQKYFATNSFDWVVNTAAYHDLLMCEQQPVAAFTVNALAVQYLAQASVNFNFRLLTLSTDYVFGDGHRQPLAEDEPPLPMQMYGVTKLAGEYLAFNHNSNTIIVRTAGLYGHEGSRHKGSNFVLSMIKESKSKSLIEVAGNQITSSTYARDLAEMITAMIEKNIKGGIYHVTNQGVHSWAELATHILHTIGSPTNIKSVERNFDNPVKRPLYTALVSAKLEDCDLQPLRDWHTAVDDYITELSTKGLI